MRFAAALSRHPVTATATGEAVGQILEGGLAEPDIAIVLVTQGHAGALEDVGSTVRTVLRPTVLFGCAAESLLANGQEVEATPAVALWAGSVGRVQPVSLDVYHDAGETPVLRGWPELEFEPSAILLSSDPWSFAPEVVFEHIARERPSLPVIGGHASGAKGRGGTRMLLDSTLRTVGAVGALVEAPITSVVSQGCRPIGRPWVVTKAEGNLICELGGKPALDRVSALAATGMTDEEREVVNRTGLHIGLVIDESKLEYEPGDFLVRNVLGADHSRGVVAVNETIPVGATVQFHIRDAATADEEMRRLLSGCSAEGALVFTCNGRGTNLFDEPDHDAGLVADLLDRPPTAGYFAQGEFGPIGGRNFVHGFTASVALFGGSRGS